MKPSRWPGLSAWGAGGAAVGCAGGAGGGGGGGGGCDCGGGGGGCGGGTLVRWSRLPCASAEAGTIAAVAANALNATTRFRRRTSILDLLVLDSSLTPTPTHLRLKSLLQIDPVGTGARRSYSSRVETVRCDLVGSLIGSPSGS